MSKFRGVLSALALVAMTSAAGAADLARPYYGNNIQPVQPTLLPAFVWTGGYIGGQLGYSNGSTRWTEAGSIGTSGFVGGLHAGYNWQVQQLVYGVEGSANWTNASGSKGCMTSDTCSADANWTGDLRLRLGYAFDRAHLFVAGGLAYANLDLASTDTPSSGKYGKFGWTLGVGAEYAMTPNWILGAEYKYSDYGKANVAADINNASFSSHVFQARASYKF